MNIAIQNLHRAGIAGNRMHHYIIELIRGGYISHLFFDTYGLADDTLRQIRQQYGWRDLGLDKVKVIFSCKELQAQCDVLLNFNSLSGELTDATKTFRGLKIVHIMDYFWCEPGSVKYKRLKECGIDYIMSYGSSDRYDGYFRRYFPDYIGKTIPVPFGFAPRFVSKTPFDQRKRKCVALGSVRPLRFASEPPEKYLEVADFFHSEQWFHKFRRMLVKHTQDLADIMDSMLPVFPRYRDYDYDMVAKFNEYQMFVSDESLFYFPSAKAFEGPASGTVMVSSDHQCFKDFGFADNENCVMHKEFDIADFHTNAQSALGNQGNLATIAREGEAFVRTHYSHPIIARKLFLIIQHLVEKKSGKDPEDDLAGYCYRIWRSDSDAAAGVLPANSAPGIGSRLLNTMCYTYIGFLYLTIMDTRFFARRVVNKLKRMLFS